MGLKKEVVVRCCYRFVLFIMIFVSVGCTSPLPVETPSESSVSNTPQHSVTPSYSPTVPPSPLPSPTATLTPTPTPIPDPYAAVDPSDQTIIFWHNHLYERRVALRYIVANFNDSNPYGITVIEEFRGGTDDLFPRFLSADNPPHLLVSYQNQAAALYNDGHLADLTPLVNSPTWGIDHDDYFTSFIAGDRFEQYQGAQLGFPVGRSMEVMYYNADWLSLLREQGLITFDGPPKTPEDFRQAACAATNNPFRDGTTPIGYAIMADASRIASWAFAFGGDIFDPEANTYTYDAPEVIEAMRYVQGLVQDGCAQMSTARFGDQDVFTAGTALFTINTSSGIPFYQQAVSNRAPFVWSTASVPHHTDDPVQNLYGPSISIRSATPEEILASWLFVRFYTAPPQQADWARGSGYFPVRQSAADSMAAYMSDNPAYSAAFDLLAYGAHEPNGASYTSVRAFAAQALREIITGADVETTLEELNQVANQTLNAEQ